MSVRAGVTIGHCPVCMRDDVPMERPDSCMACEMRERAGKQARRAVMDDTELFGGHNTSTPPVDDDESELPSRMMRVRCVGCGCTFEHFRQRGSPPKRCPSCRLTGREPEQATPAPV